MHPLLVITILLNQILFCLSHVHLPTSLCIIETVNGIIDLRALANTNGTPRFKEIEDSRGLFTYYWNPCVQFNLHQCQNTSVCQYDIKKGLYHTLGSDVIASYQTVYGRPALQYTSDTDIYRSVDILLICESNIEGAFKFVKEQPITHYIFELQSKYACPISRKLTSSSVNTMGEITRPYTSLITITPQVHHHYILEKVTIFLLFIIISIITLSMLFITGLTILVYRYTWTSLSYKAAETTFSSTSYENLTELDFINQQLEKLDTYDDGHEHEA